MRHLIPARQNRPDKDLIFALNGEATRRKQAGEKIVNATIGSLMNDDGTLAVLDTVANLLKQVPRDEWAAYAPIPGTPGYLEAECPCLNPVGFFEEPFGGDAGWDGSPQTLRVAWADGVTRYFRNDVEVLSIDWAGSGFSFGPQALYVSLGNPRPEEVDTAGMPIGAVFSNLVVEGWTGPVTPTCG